MNRTTLILAAALVLSVGAILVLLRAPGTIQSPVSCEFHESGYLRLNPDVARAMARQEFVSGRAHFERFGRGEGRAPAPNCPGSYTRDRADLQFDACDFNETNYLAMNPDVAAAVARREVESGAAHYLRFGMNEGRSPNVDCKPVRADCAFNESEYLQLNPDVARAVALGQFASGEAHYARFGKSEGRAQSLECPGSRSRDLPGLKLAPCDFNETNYLAMNPDVAAAVARREVESGVAHYLRFGAREGRLPNTHCEAVRGHCAFNEPEYLQLNPDVALAVARGDFATGAAHYARFGQAEGRAPAFDCPGASTRKELK